MQQYCLLSHTFFVTHSVSSSLTLQSQQEAPRLLHQLSASALLRLTHSHLFSLIRELLVRTTEAPRQRIQLDDLRASQDTKDTAVAYTFGILIIQSESANERVSERARRATATTSREKPFVRSPGSRLQLSVAHTPREVREERRARGAKEREKKGRERVCTITEARRASRGRRVCARTSERVYIHTQRVCSSSSSEKTEHTQDIRRRRRRRRRRARSRERERASVTLMPSLRCITHTSSNSSSSRWARARLPQLQKPKSCSEKTQTHTDTVAS